MTSLDTSRDALARRFADIALEAGAMVMEVYHSDFTVERKADQSPVSDADRRAEAVILAGLADTCPGVAVLAEESAPRLLEGHALPPTFLLVDPVDGTKEFVNKRTDFTVNIALIEDGAPTAGCVYAPALELLYIGGETAARAQAAPGGRCAGLAVEAITTRPYPADGLDAVVSRSHLDDDTQAFIDRLPVRGRANAGSSLKFCRVAEGAADVYPRFGPTMEWDTGAGHAVLHAAGGRVLTPQGEPFRYAKQAAGYRNGAFVAWGREAM